MHKLHKTYIAYYPIIMLVGIIIVNTICLLNYDYYCKNAYWINCFVGLSLLSSLQNIAMVRVFNFCSISRHASYAMLLFIPIYIILYFIYGNEPKANLYFQIIVGIVALFLTLKSYIQLYPNCTFTNYLRAKKYTITIWNAFLSCLAKNNFDCQTALTDYTEQRKKYHERFN